MNDQAPSNLNSSSKLYFYGFIHGVVKTSSKADLHCERPGHVASREKEHTADIGKLIKLSWPWWSGETASVQGKTGLHEPGRLLV